MINGKDIYDVLAALVPLYVAMVLAYGSVRWWKIFTPDQCSGINRFVAFFAVPLLSFHFIASNNPYTMNFRFIAADSLQKVVILVALFLWHAFSKNSSLDWVISLFSLSTLPNTLVMGIPLLKSMYGEFSANLMVQIVVLQSVIWYTLMLFLFEYRGAKLLISEQFPETAGSISSFRVESDVVSLSGREPLQADAEIGDDGKLHVVLRRSTSSSAMSSYNISYALNPLTPRSSNLTGVEIYSVQSSREPTPRNSSFNQTDLYAMLASKAASPKHGYTNSYRGGVGGDVYSLKSSKGPTPSTSNFEEEVLRSGMKRGSRSMSGDVFKNSGLISSYWPPPNPMFSRSTSGAMPNNGLHMYVWSSSASPVSHEGNLGHSVSRVASTEFGVNIDCSNAVLQQEITASKGTKINGDREIIIEEHSKFGPTSSTFTLQGNVGVEGSVEKKQQMPPASVVTKLILIMVWRKLIRNPNTYASLLGLIWSLISFRWNIKMPFIVKGSISILSDTGLGMAMFSLGLFMALQPKIIACGKSVATISLAVRFLAGPAVIAATSVAIGIRGVLLQVAILQAALPQGIVPFVFAKEYNVHAGILSTAVIFGMLIALPIAIVYYVLLGL